jgi:hypothetical protein
VHGLAAGLARLVLLHAAILRSHGLLLQPCAVGVGAERLCVLAGLAAAPALLLRLLLLLDLLHLLHQALLQDLMQDRVLLHDLAREQRMLQGLLQQRMLLQQLGRGLRILLGLL